MMIYEKTNEIILSLYGREMINKIRSFKRKRLKIAHFLVDLTFLKRCRDEDVFCSSPQSLAGMVQFFGVLIMHTW